MDRRFTLARFALLLICVITMFAASANEGRARPADDASGHGLIEVELNVFSGRPNPRWTVSTDEIAPFLPAQGAPELASAPEPPGLGYRGFLLSWLNEETGISETIQVFGGVIAKGAGGDAVAYADQLGLEAWLLADARERGYADLLVGLS